MADQKSKSPEPGSIQDTNEPRHSKRFRFKSAKEPQVGGQDEGSSSRKRNHRHHSSHHRSKRRRTSTHLADDPSVYDSSARNLPPDQAFRESLFDALGDDEGASFWEGIYGQPIHNYPNTYVDEDTGEVGTMNDEEYAQYVRRKMWEKSWEGIETAKEEKRREREKEKQRIRDEEKKSSGAKRQGEDFVFDFEIDASLRRGERRKDKKRWQGLWNDYIQRWEELQSLAKGRSDKDIDTEQLFLRNKIAWPVESGKRKDVNPDEIERFVKGGMADRNPNSDKDSQILVAALKLERIRWHPDKIQQRYGFMQIDEATMKGVTAVFQVFDKIWNNMRPK